MRRADIVLLACFSYPVSVQDVIRVASSVAKEVILESVGVSKFYSSLMEWKADRNKVAHIPQHHRTITNYKSFEVWNEKLDRVIDVLNRCIAYLKRRRPNIVEIQYRL
jgi:hypothetical protein